MSKTDMFTHSPEWAALGQHAERLRERHLTALFATDDQRFARLSRRLGDLVFDFSKQRIDKAAIDLLLAFARMRRLSQGIAALAGGEMLNFTEGRAAQHMALRSLDPVMVGGQNVLPEVATTRERMRSLVSALRSGGTRGASGQPIRHVVNIGIGGSDLGPRMAAHALGPLGRGDFRVSFVANLDPDELGSVLADATAAETLFIVASKTFTTQETLANAEAARAWLRVRLGSGVDLAPHFIAVSNNVAAARAFGVSDDRCLSLPEWVGGRYSMWSAIGLPIACAIGWEAFEQMLAGAREADQHFTSAPLEHNVPVLMGLLGLWNVNFLGCASHAVLPYCQRLADLPSYLQQLEMESNGKRIDRDGRPVPCDTAPVLWGGAGTVGQHAYHQLLYQGTATIPIDFIVPVGDDVPAQRMLVENALAQSAALMLGRDEHQSRAQLAAAGRAADEIDRLAPHLVCPGNQPSSTLLFPLLTPHAFGRLVALYEHKTFVQGWLWGINSFDQYGVELGKQMARALSGAGGGAPPDGSTAGLLESIARIRGTRRS
ncbi:MAG TPA: glucose-6-phosphate isomerase [Rhodocyclaceae bacterium]|nr:glucose-6-phosphate isomerase [Rhodocyclaceae bacterium]